jgi:N,N'-diacetyllegionaminate synthase
MNAKEKNMEIIAEIGWNHMGDLELAESMIKAAKRAGATSAKFQYWDPTHLKPGPWDEDGRREIYEKAVLNDSKIFHLIEYCENEGIDFLISVFGTIGAKKMRSLGLSKIKIPSHETTNLALIEYCAQEYDYIYFSCGASLESELIKAHEILKQGSAEFTLMHCISSYPCPIEKGNLARLHWLKSLHQNIGFSDHTLSTSIAAIAVACGASSIEKHFTIDKSLPGRDNQFALDESEFSLMAQTINDAKLALIDHGKDYLDIESDTVNNYRGRWEPKDYE